MKYTLRLLDSVRDHNVLDLPVIFTGTKKQCQKYAADHGYIFKADKSVYGGHFAHPATGNVIYLT